MNNRVKCYLAAYNLVAFVFWALYLGAYVYNHMQLSPVNLSLLNIAQFMALLEILHAVLKWVKSPIGSTIAQVSSRILVVVLINVWMYKYWMDGVAVPGLTLTGITIVSFAWSITELVRYSFYFLSLFKIELRPLLWARYTFFIILYPLGVTGEWLILIYPLLKNGWSFNITTAALALLFLTYAYYFPVLYGYMWKQRKAKL
jgi:very-long-chain (3R)-3-hydroxyacyl-CoA dehydratase